MADRPAQSASRPHFTNPWKTGAPAKTLQDAPDGKIAHTLTACTRCRQRKSRCDPGIPRCEPCERSNARCVYYDSTRNQTISRSYIVQLRERARALEREIEVAEKEVRHAADAELMVRGAGRIRFAANDEPRYLGPSSGIAITRLVMELAKQNTDSKSIKDVVPEMTAQEIRDMFAKESSKPTSKVYPMISSVPQDSLPPRGLTNKLIDLYMVKGQAMLPVLHEPTFRQDAEDVFGASQDAVQNFQLRMVIAISMQKLSPEYAGLADSYYLAALPFLQPSLQRMDLRSLQCLALIAQYSLVTPTRTASYWVVGAAAKLTQELGLLEEDNITKSASGEPLNVLEMDMRRRVAWVVITMEFGLAHSLGRPNAFCISHDHLNIKFPQLVDDRFITAQGILTGAKPIWAKCIAIHFFKMRLLQAEIRRTLYLNKREAPLSDQDPWFEQMLTKIDHWVESCPKEDGGSGLSKTWFVGRKNTMIIMLHRPSPQIPEPSVEAARKCYDACAFNVKMHMDQMSTGSVDLTWASTQSLFMAITTMLWTLSYPDIRIEHDIEEVKSYLQIALEAVAISAQRWPGCESALQLYRSLITACLKAYDTAESFVVHTPSTQPSPVSLQESTPPPFVSSPSSKSQHSVQTVISAATTASDAEKYIPNSRGPSAEPAQKHTPNQDQSTPPTTQVSSSPIYMPSQAHVVPPNANTSKQPHGRNINHSQYANTPMYASYGDPNFDPSTPFNTFPSIVPGLPSWDPNYTTVPVTTSEGGYINMSADPAFWLGPFGDQYSQYSNQPGPWRGRTLSQEEQIELMDSLADNIPDVSYMLTKATTIYYPS
ncbi:C6 transcription factor, putative [Talaromyces stipitatus ATCC 10500]|uniref:C6 transcription factor, putative n=1 Tax=Talaromyces stipitatus (strain ATCC 10500 / CBS 375.48 / QM 6759 / NRRL 1006) TaxID=441959 RepID=B8LVV5_TALSN|nr:C6 transcription factor, putative [Talaromyces stipitatus ATCC 10500]EED24321.1 C6 transcription factor, putative [Talaromyces stipitatus ATCC 10500]